jgi:Sulfotransferase family
MLLHPGLRDAHPLMVVGAPRCGTRFVANALNRHPAILLLGEILSPAMDNAIRFLSESGEFFASKPQWPAVIWGESRRDLLYVIWASMNRNKLRGPRGRIAWFGHKTPRHDRYWKFYQGFLADLSPKYVFCMRNFVDHYLSTSSMSPFWGDSTTDIAKVAKEYRASIRRYADMKAALGDNVSLFILDDLCEGGIHYLRETLFERLGIDVADEILARIDVSGRKNATEIPIGSWKGRNKPSRAGASRRTELTPEEQGFLDQNQDLLEALDALRAARPLASGNDSVQGGQRGTRRLVHTADSQA